VKTLTSTFEVSAVKRATKPLREIAYHQAINSLLGQSLRYRKKRLEYFASFPVYDAADAAWMTKVKAKLAEFEANEATVTRPIEACSRYHGRLVAGVFAHPVVAALYRAFMEHRPLCLSPDMIWLLICQGVAEHVNFHADALRSQFVQHEGKAHIEVRRDDFIKGSPENPWSEVIDEFCRRVEEHIGSAHDLFIPRFSTTGPAERIAAEITLLDAMRSYFAYDLASLCGIPAITLEGTVDDWQQLADRTQNFGRLVRQFPGLDLDWWLTPLQPVLEEFGAAAAGTVRQAFWQSIYKFNQFSGGAAVTGWITAFFPYLKDKFDKLTKINRWIGQGGSRLEQIMSPQQEESYSQVDGPSPGDFPSGLARAPFTWRYRDQMFDMEFLGGFVGIAQDPVTLTLRPEIGWAFRTAS
jgi:Domain of unknown function (DUF4419)